MKWIYRLEYKYGKYHIRNLMAYIVGGMALIYVANMAMPALNLISWLTLDRAAIFRGQIWRLITFVFVPPQGQPFWLLIALYFYYMMGRLLEATWGSFRLTLYYVIGILGTIAAALITGYGGNDYLNLSLFLAFATLAPDTEFLLFFIIPIKAKWMMIFYAVFAVLNVVNSFLFSFPLGIAALVSLAFSLINYFLFFGNDLINRFRMRQQIKRNRRNWDNWNR